MKDQDVPEKVAPRTVWCIVCHYDVPAALQSDDGSKRRVEVRDVVDVVKHGNALDIVGTLLGAWIQNNKAPHLAPCGGQCPSGSTEVDTSIATAFCAGDQCQTCAAFRATDHPRREQR